MLRLNMDGIQEQIVKQAHAQREAAMRHHLSNVSGGIKKGLSDEHLSMTPRRRNRESVVSPRSRHVTKPEGWSARFDSLEGDNFLIPRINLSGADGPEGRKGGERPREGGGSTRPTGLEIQKSFANADAPENHMETVERMAARENELVAVGAGAVWGEKKKRNI